MTWVSVMIIGLVIALAVGPVMMAMPSKHQNYLAELRKQALALGFHIKLTTINSGGKAQRLVAYRLLWNDKQKFNPWRLLRKDYIHEMHFCGDWDWEGGASVTLPAAVEAWLKLNLPNLPEQVRAVGADASGVSLYWREQGGSDALNALFQSAQGLQQSIRGSVSLT